MTLPVHTPLGLRLRERTQPLAPDDAQYDYAHAHLAEAMMRPFQQMGEVLDPPDPHVPWEPLFNLAIAPDWVLPWLAQVVGVRLPNGLTPDQQRNAIVELAFLKRGSPGAIKTAAGLALTGTKQVWLRERDAGDAYLLEIVTKVNETPDMAAVYRSVLLQKPAGIAFTHRTTVGWDYQQMTIDFAGKKYSDVRPIYPLYSDLTGGPLP